jgi:hypothetical protein
MVSGTRLTNTECLKTIGHADAGSRAAVVPFSTIYNYTLSFVMEEQAVSPVAGKRSRRYSVRGRKRASRSCRVSLSPADTTILFDRYDRRFHEGLELVLEGAKPGSAAVRVRGRKKLQRPGHRDGGIAVRRWTGKMPDGHVARRLQLVSRGESSKQTGAVWNAACS